MSIGKAFLYANAALIAGIASASLAWGRISLIYIIGGVGLLACILLFLRKLPLWLLVVIMLGFFIGCSWFQLNTHQAQLLYSKWVQSSSQAISGDVVDVAQSHKLRQVTIAVPNYGSVLATSYDAEIQQGMLVRFSCQSWDPKFNIQRYATQNVVAVCTKADIRITGKSSSGTTQILLAAAHIRKKLSDILSQAIPSPESELLQGIVLGEKRNLPANFQDSLQRTGTTHIVVLSGYNIAILAGIITALLRLFGFGLRRTTMLTLFLMFCFVMLTGFSPPSIRASIMCATVLIARTVGRQSRGISPLILSASVMLLLQPTLLAWSMSFQLSFLATVGVIYADQLIPFLKFLPSAFAIRESVATTTCATLLTLPVIALGFGKISLISILVNALILPLIPLSMGLGALVIVTGFFHPQASILLGSLAYCVARIMSGIIEYCSQLSFSAIDIGRIHWIFAVIWFCFLIFCMRMLHKRTPAQNIVPIKKYDRITYYFLSALCVMLAFVILFPLKPALQLSFFNVGQGDSAHLRTKSGYDVVIDGGPDDSALAGLGRDMPFFDRTIDLMVLSHPHADHITGLLSMLKRYKVRRVVVAEINMNNALSKDFFRLIAEQHSIVQLVKAGDSWNAEHAPFAFEVLAPQQAITTSETNDKSIVMRVVTPSTKILFTGDASSAVEEKILRSQTSIDADILKVGHHGSSNSSSQPFVDSVLPTLSIISAGKGNPYGHPSQQTLDRLVKTGARVLRTDICGNIKFDISESRVIQVQGPCKLDK